MLALLGKFSPAHTRRFPLSDGEKAAVESRTIAGRYMKP